jgi:hypothetical protein
MTHKGALPLKNERLILRRFTLDDRQSVWMNWTGDSLSDHRALPENKRAALYAELCDIIKENDVQIRQKYLKGVRHEHHLH